MEYFTEEKRNIMKSYDTLTRKEIAKQGFMQYKIDLSVLQKLDKLGFFEAPASTRFHGNYPGGLFDHSARVADVLIQLTNDNKLVWQNPRSPFLIGMLHDVCKSDEYEPVPAIDEHEMVCDTDAPYQKNKNTLYVGHGDKSVMLLSSMITLTEEEIACIRYHMGAYTDKDQWSYYNRAIYKFPNVLWTHMADMIASQIDEV